MKEALFADLLSSAKEMVAIEKGEQEPKADSVHVFDTVDVKAIRETTQPCQASSKATDVDPGAP